jgi:hypothetical protein
MFKTPHCRLGRHHWGPLQSDSSDNNPYRECGRCRKRSRIKRNMGPSKEYKEPTWREGVPGGGGIGTGPGAAPWAG